jgi:hypothetical protein
LFLEFFPSPLPAQNEFVVPFLLLLLPVLSLYMLLCGGWIIATFEEMRSVLGFEIYPGACLLVFLKTEKKNSKHAMESILQSKREQT